MESSVQTGVRGIGTLDATRGDNTVLKLWQGAAVMAEVVFTPFDVTSQVI